MPVWQKALKLLIKIYKLTKNYPEEEKYGLVSDMRRAANSVTHNIAEGFGRYESRDKTRFYKISRGSSYEIISQLLVSIALNYINKSKISEMNQECKDIINELDSLIKTIESKSKP